MRVLFRVAAGPAMGFGHLVRCRSIGRALGTIPAVSVRGSNATRQIARERGLDVRAGGRRLLRGGARPDVLVVDDPSAGDAAPWVRSAREQGIPVVTLHDLGRGYADSDLPIDGSLVTARFAVPGALVGPAYAVLDPSIARVRAEAPVTRRGVVIALGGGAHVRRWGHALADAVLAVCPEQTIRVVAGFSIHETSRKDPRVTWVSAPDGLAGELRAAAVAVLAGGVTLYEAAALCTPSVAVAVVPAQRPTVRAFARSGAALEGGLLTAAGTRERAAEHVATLLSDASRAAAVGQRGAELVDGHGVFRVVDAIRRCAVRQEPSRAA